MKAEKNTLTDDFNNRKALFTKLFEFQIELEEHGKRLGVEREVQAIITEMDQLMEVVLHGE